ncbi:protein MCM10 homolog [Ornithodoros turicata]|uniref:protein MCM10 homolog n=1 Tax=Ornithodoros turicata TaxID=34597 RepID=UPI0031392038
MDDPELDTLCALIDEELAGDDQAPDEASETAENVAEGRSANEIENELQMMQEKMKSLQEELFKKTGCGTGSVDDSKPSTSSAATSRPLRIKSVHVDLFAKNDVSEEPAKSSHPAKSVVHDGETDSSDDEKRYPTTGGLTATGKVVKHALKSRTKSFSPSTARPVTTWSSWSTQPTNKTDNSGVRDLYSGIRIIKPVVPADVMEARMSGRKMVKLSLLSSFVKNKITEDWVTIGVLVNKTAPKTSKNGNTYSIWKMTDLVDCENLVSFFMFGEVHQKHWKTAIGSVVGVLNPSVMPNRDSFSSRSDITLSIDHPGKVMLMGTSKDFGTCRGKSRSGQPCTNIVNESHCPYCIYHVKAEYRKMSSQRTELQASFSGVTPKGLRQKVLQKGQVMYGGQLFMNAPPPAGRAHKEKDKFLLNNLKVAKKAEEIQCAVKPVNLLHLSSEENKALNDIASKSDFLGSALSKPTAGSRNFLRHVMGEEDAQKNNSSLPQKSRHIVSVSAKDLLKMHKQQLKVLSEGQQKKQSPTIPVLGRGLGAGSSFIPLGGSAKQTLTPSDIAKIRALRTISQKGPLTPKDPNAVKKSAVEIQEKIQKRLERSLENEDEKDKEQPNAKRSRLGGPAMTQEMIDKLMDKKSSHAHELEDLELEEQVRYFKVLERKEQFEEKMSSVREMVCEVVSCSKCKYVSHQASELCKNENHPLKHHKATKRFFVCKDCKHRTYAFTRIPTRSCRNCNGSNFERTSMHKPKEGPKMDHEKLLIRGEERKFINS